MKRYLPLAAVMALLAAVAVLTWGGPESGADGGDGEARAQPVTEEPRAGALADDGSGDDVEEPPAAPADVERRSMEPEDGGAPEQPRDAPEILPSLEDGQGLRVEVVQGEEDTPVPGAEVLVVDTGRMNEMELGVALTRSRDLMGVLREYGEHYRTREDGSTVIPTARGFLVVAARKGDRVAYERAAEGVGDLLRLSLEPMARVTVRVVDDRDRPVPGVPVALRLGAGGVLQDPISATTDARGMASLEHLDVFRQIGLGNAAVHVAVSGVLPEPVQEEISLDDLPEEVVELRLPDFGEVAVEVRDLHGEPVTEPIAVMLTVAPDEGTGGGAPRWGPGGDAPAAIASSVDGVALFRPVALGLRVKAVTGQGLTTALRAEAEAPGPARAGERVTLVLEPDRAAPTLVGRVLAVDGTPVAGEMLQARLRTQRGNSRSSTGFPLATDADGRFAHALDERAPHSGGTRTLTLRRGGEREAGVATVEVDLSFALDPGPNDLGDLRLAPPPFIVSGVVLDADGAPVVGATVRVERRVTYGPDQQHSYWNTMNDLARGTDREGRFVVDGILERGEEYRLRVHHERHVQVEVPFVPGQRDLVVRMGASARLEGEVLLDEDVPTDAIEVALTVQTGPEEDDRQEYQQQLRDDGTFGWSNLQPGNATLEVRDRQGSEVLYEVAGVALVTGRACEDPRVQRIDLRGRLLAVTLRFVDEDGDRVSQVSIGREGTDDYRWAWNGETTLVTTEAALDLRVHASGHRDVVLTGVREDREVTFRDGIPLRVEVLNGMPVLPEGFALQASLQADGRQGWYRSTAATFDAAGVAEVRCGAPGTYRISVSLRRSGPGFSSTFGVSGGASPDRCEVSEGGGDVVRIEIDHEAVESTLNRMVDDD